MIEYIKSHLIELAGIIIVLIVISILSIPMIYIATKGELLFSGFYSKRALIFSAGNAVLMSIILAIVATFVGFNVADESAGSILIFLVKLAIAIGLIYGSIFPYLVLYVVNNVMNK